MIDMTRSRLPTDKPKNNEIVHKIKKLKPQKMHLDYVAGLLSIPLLIMGLIVNFSNISKKPATTTATPTPQVIVVPEKDTTNPKIVVQPTNSSSCKKAVGPITISYPQEGDTLSDNPVCFTIDYPNENYCSVVWSYRINTGSWSEYNTNAPCLYNLPSGPVSFQLRVTSTVSNDTKSLTRNFTYKNNTTNPSASSSAQ
jgi:hypothetical protein